jgi:hypothetical protein
MFIVSGAVVLSALFALGVAKVKPYLFLSCWFAWFGGISVYSL